MCHYTHIRKGKIIYCNGPHVFGPKKVVKIMDEGWAGCTPSFCAPGRQPPFEVQRITKENFHRTMITVKPLHGGRQIQQWLEPGKGDLQGVTVRKGG